MVGRKTRRADGVANGYDVNAPVLSHWYGVAMLFAGVMATGHAVSLDKFLPNCGKKLELLKAKRYGADAGITLH